MAQEISLETLAGAKAREALSGKTDGQPVVEDIQEEKLSPEQLARVEEIKNSIDLTDSQTALQYGVGAQRSIAGFADSILSQVRSKDSGYVGELMSDLVIKVKDVGVDKLNEDSFADKIPFFRTASRSLKKFMQRYEDLEVQIGRIEGELEKARMEMLKDVAMFDGLYEKNLEYFQELQIYIAAGEEKLKELREETIPRLREQAGQKGDPMSAQLVSDFEDTVNRFEKKVHDLKLSRTIAIQTAPQIRLVQSSDSMMIEKIQSTVVNTIPLWKSQMVIALGVEHANQAAKAQREVTDMTNQLLRKNAEALKTATVESAKASERGIVDLETLKNTNAALISTFDEVLKIQEDGRKKRREAEAELNRMEAELKSKLLEIHR